MKISGKSVECICEECGTVFNKPANEYNRSMRVGRKLYCSLNCSGAAGVRNNNFGGKANKVPPSIKNPKPINSFKYYLNSCNSRDQVVTITVDYLKELWDSQEGRCAYLKIPLILSNYKRLKVDMRYSASLDRIDSTKGYIEGNVQFISRAINFMKNTMSHNETLEFLRLIAQSINNQLNTVEVCGVEPRLTCQQ